jgi:hypothetical protein
LKKFWLITGLIILLSGAAWGQNYTWNGATNGNWNTGSNWAGGTAPAGTINNLTINCANPPTTGIPATITVGGTLTVTNGTLNLPGTLTVNGTGTSTISANITTGGNQTYQGPVSLGADVNFTGGANSLVRFNGTVNGTGAPRRLTITTANARFNTNVGAGGNIASIEVVNGTTRIGARNSTGTINIITTGGQSYNGLVTLGSSTNFIGGTGDSIWFKAGVEGLTTNRVLTVTGNAQFDGAVGSTANNYISVVNVTGTSSINANVTSTGNQTYTGAVTLGGGLAGAARILTSTGAGTTITLGTVTGEDRNLTITAGTAANPGTAVFTNGGSGIGTLTVNQNVTFNNAALSAASVSVTRNSTINADITTTGSQTYRGTVTLNADISSGTDITFRGAVTLNADISSGTDITFDSLISGSPIPVTLTKNGTVTLKAGGAIVNNGSITVSSEDTNAAFIGNYEGSAGSLTGYNGASAPYPYIEFHGDADLSHFTQNDHVIRFAGTTPGTNNDHVFKLDASHVGNVEILAGNTVTVNTPVTQDSGKTLSLGTDSSLILTPAAGSVSWIQGTSPPPGFTGFYGGNGTVVFNAGSTLKTEDFFVDTNCVVTLNGAGDVIASGNVEINNSFNGGNDIYRFTINMYGTNTTLKITDASIFLCNLAVNGTTTLETGDSSDNSVTFKGSVTINPGGELDCGGLDILMLPRWNGTPPPPFPSTEPHNFWEQRGTFNYGTNAVEFGSSALSGHTYTVRGDTAWWILACHEDSATLQFSNYGGGPPNTAPGTFGHIVYGGLQIEPVTKDGTRNITLTRKDYKLNTPAIPPNQLDPPTEHFWYFITDSQTVMNIAYVDIYYCFSGQTIRIPPFVNVLPYNAHWNVGWLGDSNFFYAYTEDSTHTGKIDRIRLQAAFDIMPFTVTSIASFRFKIELIDTVTRESYTGAITGYRRVQENPQPSSYDDLNSIYVLLDENKMPYNTGIIFEWKITENDEIFDLASGELPIGNPGDSGITTDTAPPRITYALAVPGHNEIYFQVSEDITNTGGLSVDVPVLSLSGLIPQPNSTGKREFIVSLGNYSFTPDQLAGGAEFILHGLADSANPAVDLLYLSPRYPQNYNYDDKNLGTGAYTFQPYVTVAGNPAAFIPPAGITVVFPKNKGYELSSGKTIDLDPSIEVKHRAADLLVSVPPGNLSDEQYFIWPLWAKYSNVTDPNSELGAFLSAGYGYMGPGGGDKSFNDAGIIWDFSGKRFLEQEDITLQSRLSDNLSLNETHKLIYAFNVPEGCKSTNNQSSPGLWHPGTGLWNSGIKPPIINPPCVNLFPDSYPSGSADVMNGKNKLYNIDLSKSKYSGDSTVEFFYHLDGTPDYLLAGRLDMAAGSAIPADWYRRMRPFSFNLHEVTRQRGSVTILNNVINSEKRERVFVDYKLNKSGRVTVQVFTLDGNLVKVLVRENQNQSDAYYRASWDGTNSGGRPVARGMYFIRVVAPDIDEIRKVMVVK